eukprot:g1023.t1
MELAVVTTPKGTEWHEAHDHTGRAYYYSESTGETRWNPPGGKPVARAPAAPGKRGAGAAAAAATGGATTTSRASSASASCISLLKRQLPAWAFLALFGFMLLIIIIVAATAGGGGGGTGGDGGDVVAFDLYLDSIVKNDVELQEVRESVGQLLGVPATRVGILEVLATDMGVGCKVEVQPGSESERTNIKAEVAAVESSDTKAAELLAIMRTRPGLKSCSRCKCGPPKLCRPGASLGGGDSGGSSGDSAPAPVAPPSGGGGDSSGGGGSYPTDGSCIPPNSVPGTCKRCLDSGQCQKGSFCCPLLKLCLNNPRKMCKANLCALCSPRCGSAKGCKCQHKDAKNWPHKWQKPTCKKVASSADGTVIPATYDDPSTGPGDASWLGDFFSNVTEPANDDL